MSVLYSKIKIFFLAIIITACSSDDTIPTQDTDGQNNNPDITETITLNPKKGLGITFKATNWKAKVEKLNVSWHYSWGSNLPSSEPEGVEYVPMLWGANKDPIKLQEKLDEISTLISQGIAKKVLGFNEPDGSDQSNIEVERALENWSKLEQFNLPLGSPAPVNTENEWMTSFMSEAKTQDLKIDFVCMHWYGGINVSSFLDKIVKTYELYGKPIWITEFAPADWSATSPATSKHTKAEILAFMKEVLPKLDDLSYVQRYAWFSAKTTSGPLGNAALYDDHGNLTTLGEFYRDHN